MHLKFVFVHQCIAWISWMAVAAAGEGVAMLDLQGQSRLSPGIFWSWPEPCFGRWQAKA